MFPKGLIRDFQRIRIEAEKCARKRLTRRNEIILIDIYNYLAYDYMLNSKQIEILMGLEIDIEIQHSFEIPETTRLIKKLLSNNEKVVFISDMYLPFDVIKMMLEKADSGFSKIPLYVSCECNATKSSGELFKYVAKKENIDYTQWIHIGDNRHSDIAVPQKYGIDTILVEYTSNDYLYRYLDAKFISNSIAHIYGGCSKIAKLYGDSRNFTVGACYGAPLLVGYAEWILDIALSNGISEIYFVSRDGFIPKRICDYIIKSRKYLINTKYIYGSRKAFANKDIEQQKLRELYIKRNIDVNQDKLLFVDSFGIGASIEEVSKFIKTYSECNVYSTHIKRTNYEFNDAYTVKCEFAKNIDVWDNIEIISSAPQGTCKGYCLDPDGNVVPVINDDMTNKILDFGYNDYIKGIDMFMDIYIRVLNISIKSRSSVLEVFKEYINIMNMFPPNNILNFLLDYPEKKQDYFFKLIRKNEIRIKKWKYIFKIIEKQKILNLLHC